MKTRRQLFQGAALAVAGAPLVVKASTLGLGGATAPSDKIAVACIGLGWMGFDGHVKDFAKVASARVVAVCDLDETHLTRARSYIDTEYGDQGCTPYHAFEEVLMRRDIDAVSIALPDHWHAIVATQAARAKKDIYCEKPLAHNFHEGLMMVQAAQENARIWQTGSWQRSVPNFRQAAELVRNGRIGKLKHINVWAPASAPGAPAPTQVLGNLANFAPGSEMGTVSHYDVQPVIDILANVNGTDLGTVTRAVERQIALHQKNGDLPHGSLFTLRGQSETMKSSYIGLLGGLAFSILLVYLLIVVNFQSWLDPFVIIAALPAALGGIVWFLFLTHTRLSVPALTGAIMCMGVATANSILVGSFAREQLEVLVGDARRAALNAGFVRLRPVLMTALAMILGMAPMALGLGDGGEQNAPLGRAVIGGLLLATVATLFFVPAFFSFIHGRIERQRERDDESDAARFDEFDARPE